jgi:Tfp pilus assembly protein PilP
LGKVIAINDKTVDIDEWVADSTGGWVRRQTQLVLQERK